MNCDYCETEAEFHLCSRCSYQEMKQKFSAERQIKELESQCSVLVGALKPFAWLARVMSEGNVLVFNGVYITYEQAVAAEKAISKAEGDNV